MADAQAKSYFVITLKGDIGPLSRGELREQFHAGFFAPGDHVRNAFGRMLGTVAEILGGDVRPPPTPQQEAKPAIRTEPRPAPAAKRSAAPMTIATIAVLAVAAVVLLSVLASSPPPAPAGPLAPQPAAPTPDPTPTAAPTLIATDLRVWWKFNETSGTTASDSSGNNNRGTLTNMVGTAWTAGKLMELATADGGGMQLVVRTTGSASLDNSGGLTEEIAGTQNLCDGSWHHVAAVRTGKTYRLYVDGALVISNSNAANTAPTYTRLAVAAYIGGGNPFQGKLDDVRVYSRALSGTEIQAVYNSGQAAPVNNGGEAGTLR
jgi:hypothetical protein